MKILLQLAICIFFVENLAAHPSHVSVVNMDINRDQLRIDYSVHFFQEDYNYLVYGVYHDEVAEALSDSTINLNNIIVNDYIEKRFLVSLDGVQKKPDFAGIKNEESGVWLYFTIKLDQIPDSVSISNKIFLELYRDQINLFILAYGSLENGFTFDYENTEQRFALKNI